VWSAVVGGVTALAVLVLDRRLAQRQRLTELYLDAQEWRAHLLGNAQLSLELRPPDGKVHDFTLESGFDDDAKRLAGVLQMGVSQLGGFTFSWRLRRVRRKWSEYRRDLVLSWSDRRKLVGVLERSIELPARLSYFKALGIEPSLMVSYGKMRSTATAMLVTNLSEPPLTEVVADWIRQPDGLQNLKKALEVVGEQLPSRRRKNLALVVAHVEVPSVSD
jgi:hypothetical protein